MQDPLSEVLLIIVGSSIIIFLLTGSIVFALLVSQKRKFLYAKKISDIQHNFEQEVLKTQVETHLQTLDTISQELHDNVGTMVSIAIVHMKSLAQNISPTTPMRQNIDESQKLLEEALDVLRDISRSINPENISRYGLIHAFRNEIDLIQRTKSIETEYHVRGAEFPIPAQHQVIIFRIVQESLNNILKHANATKLTLSVELNQPHLIISITDNGIGFLSKETMANGKKSSGLANMKKRAEIINGSLEIVTGQAQGTEVRFSYSI